MPDIDLWGPNFSDFSDPMIIFTDTRDITFNSREPIRVPEIPLKKP